MSLPLCVLAGIPSLGIRKLMEWEVVGDWEGGHVDLCLSILCTAVETFSDCSVTLVGVTELAPGGKASRSTDLVCWRRRMSFGVTPIM